MKTILLSFVVIFTSCAGMMRQPLPSQKRTLEYSIPSKHKSADLYQNVKFWIPTELKTNNQLIQAEDKESRKISGSAYIPCKELPGSSMASQSIEFQYLISVKDKNVSVKLSNQRIYVPDDVNGTKETNIFNDESQLPGVKTCFDQLIANMTEAVK